MVGFRGDGVVGRQGAMIEFRKSAATGLCLARRSVAGIAGVGMVPGDFERDLPIGIQTANVIEALRKGAAILEPHGIIMVLEPLSDSPNLFLRNSDQTYAICKAVNSPSCKIVDDMYHQQITEGNLIPNIDLAWNEIAAFHLGDTPGRNEPTTGEINFKNVFKQYLDIFLFIQARRK